MIGHPEHLPYVAHTHTRTRHIKDDGWSKCFTRSTDTPHLLRKIVCESEYWVCTGRAVDAFEGKVA